MSKIKHFSASSISLFLACPMKWYNKYVLRREVKIDYKEYIIYGTALHAALELNYKQKINSRVDLDTETLVVFFKKHFQELCDKERRQPNQFNVDNLKKEGEKSIAEYMKVIAPHNQPIAVEKEFFIKSEAYGVTIKGFIDLITEDGRVIDFKTVGKIGGYIGLLKSNGNFYHIDETKKETEFIKFVNETGEEIELDNYKGKFLTKKGELQIDKLKNVVGVFSEKGLFTSFKNTNLTADRTYSQSYVDNMIQLTMYAIAYRKLYGKVEKSVGVELLKRLKGGAKVQTVTSTRTSSDLTNLSQLMVQLKSIIGEDLFYPNLTECNTCDYKNECLKKLNKVEEVVEVDLDGLSFEI